MGKHRVHTHPNKMGLWNANTDTYLKQHELYATYVINRLPSKVLHGVTPYEVLFKKPPVYDHMRIFGCLAYYRSTETGGDKFELRGRPGIFGTKGYKIYDLEYKKIIVSRDVRFVEHEFPMTCIPNTQRSREEDEDIFVFADKEVNTHTNQHATTLDNPINNDHNSLSLDDMLHDENSESLHENDHVNSEDSSTNNQRTTRIRSQPTHFQDYVVQLPPSISHPQSTTDHVSSTVHPLTNYVSYDKFTTTHKSFLAAIVTHDEPKKFHQAVKDDRWKKAMQREITGLEENNTWELTLLPPRKKAIDSKWVYKIKYKPNGEVERYKARLVAKGYTQMEGVDFHDTFAPVAKLVTVRVLLTIAVKHGWIIHQLDVNNAFLHGDLNEEIYMKIPQGFRKENETRVCKLKKSLYGLKQASRNWYQKFTTTLQKLEYRQSQADHSLFIHKHGDVFVAALIYVDDVIIVGNNQTKIEDTKSSLDTSFSIKDLGDLKYFLGIEVARTTEGLVLSQRKYTIDILEDSGLLGCRPSQFPMEQNLKLDKGEDEERADVNAYRRLVGRILYLQATRPDITYVVNVLSQFVSDHRQNHWNAAMRVLRYLKATLGQGILLPKGNETDLIAYSDSDWLGCPFSRRSRTGYVLLLGGAPISWKSKKQSVVSRSSGEAEYRAMATTVSEILWTRWLLTEFDVEFHAPIPLLCDNNSACHIAHNPVFHERTKHVEMDFYFVRERVLSKEIVPVKINTQDQLADLLTKPLGSDRLKLLSTKLGIRNLHAPA
uniref:Reverse transcriptase Ty1/copia-type domain-containing protein n=1 Tax=Lactuca sativa TaxID=4236 RepID=A0A9R1UGE4_LACSA|nr:hypothetical protein LSAT_V11C900486210 [Lactuca sativa]